MEKQSAMRALVEAVAGPRQFSDNRKSWLARAAKRAGIKPRAVKAVFYGEITDPGHHAVRLLQYAAQRRAQVLAGQYETIARGMESSDSDFYRAHIHALIDVARALRGLNSPGTDSKE